MKKRRIGEVWSCEGCDDTGCRIESTDLNFEEPLLCPWSGNPKKWKHEYIIEKREGNKP